MLNCRHFQLDFYFKFSLGSFFPGKDQQQKSAFLILGYSSGTLETCFTLRKLPVSLKVRIIQSGLLKTRVLNPLVMEPVVIEKTKRISQRIAARFPKDFASMTHCPILMNLFQICSVSIFLFDSFVLNLEFEFHSSAKLWFVALYVACLCCKCTFSEKDLGDC